MLGRRWLQLRGSGPRNACTNPGAIGAPLDKRDAHFAACRPSAPGLSKTSIYFTASASQPGGGRLKLWSDASPDRSARYVHLCA